VNEQMSEPKWRFRMNLVLKVNNVTPGSASKQKMAPPPIWNISKSWLDCDTNT